MINFFYNAIRRLITRKEEQNQYSGGLWPRLVREEAAMLFKGETCAMAELGCGEGLFLKKLAANNPCAQIYGIDSWPEILSMAEKNLAGAANVHLLNENGLATARAASSFFRCFCLNTTLNLASFDEVEKLIVEAHRILLPGGTFVFDIRNAANPVIGLQYRFARIYDTKLKVPLIAYNAGRIRLSLERHGFAVRRAQPVGFPRNRFAPAILFAAEKI
ncbi:MAG: hypothetical protein A2314_06125 [Elusimicrobia bacterium RIFOXYB2_FULL_50_12]|nr:MAG: hypothetical protein A2314_06125 [Elusimicrobia bacterium RIFOXYB2_FULL_50_12]